MTSFGRPGMIRFIATAAASLMAAASLAGAGPAAASRADNIPPPVVDTAQLPPIVLSARVLDMASEYRAYMRRTSALNTHFQNGDAIEKSLAQAETYEPQQLVRGAVAYAAVIALQDPAFVAGVRVYAVNRGVRKDFADRILADPYYITGMPGAGTAANMIMTALHAHGQKMAELGGKIRLAAYDVQREQPWSKSFVTDRNGRLASAKALSSAPMTPVPEDVASLASAVSGSTGFIEAELPGGATTDAAPAPYSQFVARSLALAALAALGEGGDDNDAALDTLLNDSSAGFCLNMSKLNLYQCLAVAKPWYEDMFCLGLHAMADTGQCIAKAAGDPTLALQQPAPGVAPTGAPGASVALHGKPPGER